MPPTPPRHATDRPSSRRHRLTAVAVLLAVSAGCGAPPELRSPTPTRTARTAQPAPTGTPTAPPTNAPTGLPGLSTPTPTGGLVAVACTAGPSGQRVTDLVRGRDVLPRDARVRVRTGPLCAEDWHYTVLDVTGYEPLQVVTRGTGAAPRLVTAGTDVCTVEVRVTAPVGVRTLACDAGPLTPPGA
ncbi:hypothetical protein [Micromonospora sp. NPDC126480]|uniref:hypothetical protein n=1 Tax=Micromonospora sp. NPDC126480 TaxID=3155312 RepID=UPI0033196251